MDNKIMLVTYPESMGGNLARLHTALDNYFSEQIGNVHILPFYPSSGDRGFAPVRYDCVAPAFGTWADIEALGNRYGLMSDFMINHISRQSEFFQDFAHRGNSSAYKNMFIIWDEFWPGGSPTDEQYRILYRRRPRAPYTVVTHDDGSQAKVWTTFSEEQIDLNLDADEGRTFVEKSLAGIARHGIKTIRLDAFACATKRPGTSCFFVEPDIWKLFQWVERIVAPFGVQILPEIHADYQVRQKLSRRGFWTYDFALPMLVLHALYSGNAEHLVRWIGNSPKHQFTTLDTHDGIGVIDVSGVLSAEEITYTKESIFSKGDRVKPEYNTVDYNNLDIYQINCTYYSALGKNDASYLLARAVQFFAPGIPQVYYVGLLAGANDIDLLEQTREGRNINRHNYTSEELKNELQRPVVCKLMALMAFRNSCPAFDIEGDCFPVQNDERTFTITRAAAGWTARLDADVALKKFTITEKSPEGGLRTVIQVEPGTDVC